MGKRNGKRQATRSSPRTDEEIIGRYVGYDRLWGTLLVLTCICPIIIGGDDSQWIWDLYEELDENGRRWLLLGSACGVAGAVLGWFRARGVWRHALNLGLATATLYFGIAATDSDLSSLKWSPPDEYDAPITILMAGALLAYVGGGLTVANPFMKSGRLIGLVGSSAMIVAFFVPFGDSGSAYDGLRAITKLDQPILEWADLLEFDNEYTLLIASLFGGVAGGAICGILSTFPFGPVPRIVLAQLSRLCIAWVPMAFVALLITVIAQISQTWQVNVSMLWLWFRLIAPAVIALDATTTTVALLASRE